MVNITMEKVAKYLKSSPYLMAELNTQRKFDNAVKRRYEDLVEIYNRPLVKEMLIRMEWKKNRTYGWNPSAVAFVKYANGKTGVFEAKAKVSSGGYDKAIHLIEVLMNDAAIQNLYHKRLSAYKNHPNKGFHTNGELYSFYDINSRRDKFSFFTIDHVVDSPVYDEFLIKFN